MGGWASFMRLAKHTRETAELTKRPAKTRLLSVAPVKTPLSSDLRRYLGTYLGTYLRA